MAHLWIIHIIFLDYSEAFMCALCVIFHPCTKAAIRRLWCSVKVSLDFLLGALGHWLNQLMPLLFMEGQYRKVKRSPKHSWALWPYFMCLIKCTFPVFCTWTWFYTNVSVFCRFWGVALRCETLSTKYPMRIIQQFYTFAISKLYLPYVFVILSHCFLPLNAK